MLHAPSHSIDGQYHLNDGPLVYSGVENTVCECLAIRPVIDQFIELQIYPLECNRLFYDLVSLFQVNELFSSSHNIGEGVGEFVRILFAAIRHGARRPFARHKHTQKSQELLIRQLIHEPREEELGQKNLIYGRNLGGDFAFEKQVVIGVYYLVVL